MGPSYFPLRDDMAWVYAATDPVASRLVTLRVRPPVEIEVEDMLTHEVRREKAWILAETGKRRPQFGVEREHGVQILRRRRFGEPAREATVVTEELRWGGEATWSIPSWHYTLGTLRYRRVGEEEVTVTAGLFRCLKILVDEGETGTIWLAPDVGIVRSVGSIEGLVPTRYAVLELQAFPVRERWFSQLTFCVHCGLEVDRYAPGSVSPDELFIHGVEQPPEEVYQCPRCGPHPSPFMEATGQACPGCDQICPSGLAYCGYCGKKLP